MRSAILFSGTPRFCRQFDSQLANLQNSNIDWFVVFWKEYNEVHDDRRHWVTPTFRKNITESQARQYIEDRLPSNHKLIHFEFIDPLEFPPPPSYYTQILGQNPHSTYAQEWILNQCDLRRQQYGEYDLVIRSRPDIGIPEPVNLELIYNHLIKHKDLRIIYIPRNYREPQNNEKIIPVTNFFTIGLPETMKIYCNSYYELNLSLFQEDFHIETIMSKIWAKLNLIVVGTEIDILIRNDGIGSQHTDFIPNFGRWN